MMMQSFLSIILPKLENATVLEVLISVVTVKLFFIGF